MSLQQCLMGGLCDVTFYTTIHLLNPRFDNLISLLLVRMNTTSSLPAHCPLYSRRHMSNSQTVWDVILHSLPSSHTTSCRYASTHRLNTSVTSLLVCKTEIIFFSNYVDTFESTVSYSSQVSSKQQHVSWPGMARCTHRFHSLRHL